MKKFFGVPNSPTSDQSRFDANAPDDAPQSDNPMGTPPKQAGDKVMLSKQFVDAAGLTGLSNGQTFTVQVTGTVSKASPEGIEADITDASMGEVQAGDQEPGGSESDDDGQEDEQFQSPKGNVEMGPGKMKGF